MIQFVKEIQKLHEEKESFVVVTLTKVRGSAPQEVGAKMIVTPEGLHWGTVGGGKIEAHCVNYAATILKTDPTSTAHVQTWNLQKDIGMSCGGEVDIFFDINHKQSWNVAIFGAGHLSQELCRVLQTWDCDVHVFDTRKEWIEKIVDSPNIFKHLSNDLSKEVSGLTQNTYLLSMTKGHASDVPVLKEAFKEFDKYKCIGVIGSNVKAKKIKLELLEHGFPKEQVERLHSPMGLPIGRNNPPEIAISICSMLLCLKEKSSFNVDLGKVIL